MHSTISGLKIKIKGSLLVYSTSGLAAYENETESDKTVVLVGGLGDRMMTLSYIQNFLDFCAEHKMRLVIPELTSHPNFRTVSIEQDLEDIGDLLRVLEGDIILIGHSTGCQDILLYMEKYGCSKVKGLVLQGPVSDIEYLPDPAMDRKLALIADFGRTDSRFVEIDGVIWLKERFSTLFTKCGREDLFSSYLDDEAFARWKKIPARILSVVSESDEYCLQDTCPKLELMGDVHVIKGGRHCLDSEEHRSEFVSAVSLFLKKLDFI